MRALIKSTTQRSFRRAGIEFTPRGVEVDLNSLSDAQVGAIYGEPRLVVTLLEVPKREGKAASSKNNAAKEPGEDKTGVANGGATVASTPAGSATPAGAEAAPAAKPAKAAKAKAA